MKIFLLFPINLYKNIEILKDKHILLIEEELFFTKCGNPPPELPVSDLLW